MASSQRDCSGPSGRATARAISPTTIETALDCQHDGAGVVRRLPCDEPGEQCRRRAQDHDREDAAQRARHGGRLARGGRPGAGDGRQDDRDGQHAVGRRYVHQRGRHGDGERGDGERQRARRAIADAHLQLASRCAAATWPPPAPAGCRCRRWSSRSRWRAGRAAPARPAAARASPAARRRCPTGSRRTPRRRASAPSASGAITPPQAGDARQRDQRGHDGRARAEVRGRVEGGMSGRTGACGDPHRRAPEAGA